MTNSAQFPIIFFFGPSGAGKTTLAEWLKEDLNFIHLKIDRADGDGIDIEDLRDEWNAYYDQNNAEDLAKVLRQKIHELNKSGVVLTFASTHWLKIYQVEEAERYGIITVVLYGSEKDCLGSYMAREKIKNRGFDADHWIKYNVPFYPNFTDPNYAKYRINTFHNHEHLSKSSLIEAISQRIDASY
jgi:ABC-type branched-subunit amino acid transport system ATPase component